MHRIYLITLCFSDDDLYRSSFFDLLGSNPSRLSPEIPAMRRRHRASDDTLSDMEKSARGEPDECRVDTVRGTDRVSQGVVVLHGLQAGHLVLITHRRNNECDSVYDNGRRRHPATESCQ